MIVELFGPPCVGKTTFASTVADGLRQRGHGVRLVLSYRPLEVASGSGGAAFVAPLRRLVRPLVECIAAAAVEPAERNQTIDLTALMQLVPATRVLRSVRLRQYLLRLTRMWHEAETSNDIVFFDQGFVQAVSSAAVVAATIDPERIGVALDTLPEADLLIRLHAPRGVLEKRLAKRRDRQGWLERLFDTWANLDSMRVFDAMDELLRSRGRRVAYLNATEGRDLQEGADLVEALAISNQHQSPARAACRLQNSAPRCCEVAKNQ